MNNRLFRTVVCASLLGATGCSGDDDGDTAGSATQTTTTAGTDTAGTDTAGTDTAGTDTAATGTGAATITVTGNVGGFAEMAPIEGAQVCFYDHPEVPCAMTDADGNYVLADVPANTQGALEATAAGHIPLLIWGITGSEDDVAGFGLISDAAKGIFEQALGDTFDPAKAYLSTGSFNMAGGVAGVTFAITPDSGTQAYVTDASIPDATMTETAANGIGGWLNVDPGEIEISATHATATCASTSTAIPGSTSNSAKVTAVAGYFNTNSGAFECL